MRFSRVLGYAAVCAALMLVSQAAFGADITPQKDAKKGTWGYVGSNGKWVVKPKYESAAEFTVMPDGKEASQIKHKGLIGYVDANGKLMGAGAVFESVEPLEGNAMLVKVKGKYGVTDYSCVYLVKPELESVEKVDGGRMLVSMKGKQGLLSPKGEFIVLPEYERVDLSLPEYIRVTKGGKVGLLRADDGMVQLKPDQYTAIEPFGQYWKVSKGDKKGLLNQSLNSIIVKPDYTDVMQPVSMEGGTYFPVKKDDKWGVINNIGKQVVKCKYKSIAPLCDLDLILLRKPDGSDNLWFSEEDVLLNVVMDNATINGPFTILTGTIKEPASYESPAKHRAYKKFNRGKFEVMTDKDGNVVSTDNVTVRQMGSYYTLTKANSDRCDVYSSDGKQLLTDVTTEPEKTGSSLLFGDKLLTASGEVLSCQKAGGQIYVQQPDKLWHMMTDGKIAPDGYEAVTDDGHGVAEVKKNGKWGVVYNGKQTIACESDSPLKYDENLMGYLITENGKQGIRKPDGTILVQPKYDEITGSGEEYNYYVSLNNKQGMVSSEDGSEILPPEYDAFLFIPQSKYGNMMLRKGDLYGVITPEGKIIIPVKYEKSFISVIDNRYFEVLEKGGKLLYYDYDGTRLSGERKVTVTEQWIEQNTTDNKGVSCLKYHFSFELNFLIECPVYVEAKVYHSNGKPALNSYKQQIKHGFWVTPEYLFAVCNDRWISFPYNNFRYKVPKGTKKDFYIKITFKYDNDKPVSTKGNEKVPFSLYW